MMSANTIRNALGVLQDEPDNEQAWTDLRSALGYLPADPPGQGRPSIDPGNTDKSELSSLLEAARRAHEMRREYEAVGELLEIEVALAAGEREGELTLELARLRDDILLDDAGALAAYRRALELRPNDAEAKEAVERSEVKRGRWKDLAQKYFTEAKGANDPAFKSSLLVNAAEIAYRYARPELEARQQAKEGGEEAAKGKKKGKKKEAKDGKDPRRDLLEKIIGLLRDALACDPRNRRAAILLERILHSEERWDELTAALDTFGAEVTAKDEKIAAWTRLARILKKKLSAQERAMTAYEKVLDLSPAHPEATRALVDHFTEREMWDHLVSLYSGQLTGGGVHPGQEVGVIFQIAMVNWRMRNKPEAAEPYFERLRKHEPAHPGMLNFFREWCTQKGEQARLLQVLTDAQRAMPDGPERATLAAEIAQHAEVGANAQKAIEQWRTILRAQPTNVEAREALKRLYRTSGAYNHLADLLRSELERVAPDDAAVRLPVLREIAEIYRDNLKSESALVTVLSQIIALDGNDAGAVRELARVYEALGRWRDLLTTQMRLAELEPNPNAKAELFRAAGRRWLEQFSNVQNAVEAFEKLHEVAPEDREAVEKLKELYGKRRAYRQLFDLYESEAKRATGAERRSLWVEMAKMAADRLDRGADATRLYKQILAEDPDDSDALDALEKQAEREKDFATVAEVLERRVELGDDPQARLTTLQKLGSVYADRLNDHMSSLRVWRRVLDLSPGHTKAVRILRDSHLAMNDFDGLTELYSKTGDWEGFAETLSSSADRASDDATKIDLSFRVASVFETKLGAPERAFRAYERVLSVRPDDKRAATALVPLYERDEQWARLPALYDVLLGHATAVDEKRALYIKLADVTGERLSDKTAAFRHAKKAYELAPTDSGSVELLERWASRSGEWTAFTETLQARLDSDASGDERRRLQLKIAEVSAAHTGRSGDAIAAYKELIQQSPDDAVAVAELERLLRASPDRRDDLRWLLRLRVGRASGETAVALLAEWALLEEDAFGEPARAVELYRELLALDPTHAASLRALSRLLVAQGDARGAVEVLLKERDLESGDRRAARELEIARLYHGSLKSPRDAMSAAKRALEILPKDPGVIALVEELLPVPETRGEAANVLEAAYAAAGQFEKQGDVLGVLIATAPSKQDRLALHLRLAAVKQNLGDRAGAFDVLAKAAIDSPAELDLWDRLAVLANKTGKTQQFVETIAMAIPETGETGLPPHVEMDLAERAATLYDENLGDIDRATPYLDRILHRDPSNERAFARLKQILTSRERWKDLEALYEKVLAATESAERRSDLLAEVAIIAEEITGDAPKAIQFYERILEIEPGHEQAMFALDKLYASHERYNDLAALLRRRIELAGSSANTSLKLRLGTLLFVKLADPKSALDYLEEVVTEDPSEREARDLVEKSLSHPDLRQRAAVILEGIYADREEIRDLVRILEVRLEFVTGDAERRELLRRLAELRDERLSDDAGSFETYARLLPLSPADVEARQRFIEIAGRVGKQAQAAETLTTAASNADAPQPRAEILGDVAKLYEALGETGRSESVQRQVLELAPEDPSIALPAARALERIYVAGGTKMRELADVLRVQVKLEEQTDVRHELLGRLAKISEESLRDDGAAVAAWKQRLEDNPADDEALAALDRLYERAADHRSLVEVLRSREQGADDPEKRRPIMLRIAKTLETLAEMDDAIVAYRSIIDDFGADRTVLGALAALYDRGGRARDLAETLEADLGLATEAADRVQLLTRMGDVRRKNLGEISEAIEAYRQALTIDPSTVPAREALEALLTDDGAKADAAEILRPLYEVAGTDDKLLRVLDIQIEQEESLDARLDLLARAASVAEGSLRDIAKAFAYASRGLREGAGEASVATWIERIERLSTLRSSGEPGTTSHWAEVVELYRSVVSDIVDEEQQVGLWLRVAEIARTNLADAALAKECHRKVLDIRPEETRALVALEALHEEAREYEPLLEILKRRAEIAEADDDKRAIIAKEANVCDALLGDRDRAIGFYEEILELGLDASAVAALERLYAATSRWGDLVALHERELGSEATTPERRATLLHGLGSIYQKQLGEPDRAFESYAEALSVNPTHDATVASLEQIVAARATGDRAHTSRAAEMLENVYMARLDWRKVMGAVEARLEGSEDPDERRDLLRRLAKLHEEQEENYRAALDVMAKLLAEDVTDESTWAELERLARVASNEARLVEIYSAELEKITSDEPATARLAFRTAELFEGQKQTNRALQFYRRAYAFSPEDEQKAFQAIDRLLTETKQASERVVLYREALEYRTDVPVRVATLHTIARIEEEDLGDDDAAIASFRNVLDVDESDVAALDALTRLFTRREKWRELGDLYRRRAEQSALPEDEAKWRLLLSGVLDGKLGETVSAMDELETILGLAPASASHAGAVAALEQLLEREDYRPRAVELLRPIYEQADDWQKLVAVARHRYAIAASPNEKVAVLRDMATLLEERGSDLNRAFDCLKEAFTLDPDDGDTREELDRVAVATSRWDDLADAYEQGIAKLDGIGRRELLESLARLHDKRRDDPRKALAAWERLFSLDESDVRPLDEMDQLATLLSDWSSLVRVLAKRAELTNDDEERASLWRRIGESRRDMLDDQQGSIDAYERALELEPESAWTLDNLIPLYEGRNDAARLVDLYRRRIELCSEDDVEMKYTLLLDAAKCYEVGLQDRREAVVLLGQALAVRPNDPAVMARLADLFEVEKMWPELLDNLRAQVELAEDAAVRRATTKRIGHILATELDDHAKAIEAFREVLSAGYDEEVAKAVRQIGESRDELRREAADLLEPVLAAASRHDELADVLELRLRAELQPSERAQTLRALAKVAEDSLRDLGRAQSAFLRALADEPQDAGLHAENERVAALVGREGWVRYSETLGERAASIFDAKVTAALFTRLGKVAEEQLSDMTRAAEAYSRAAEQGGDDAVILVALERIYGGLGDTRALVDVIERRITVESDPAAQADLYHRLASLQIDSLGEKGQGLATLRLALDRVADHAASRQVVERLLSEDALFDDAFDTLEGVYRRTNRGEDLARLYERRVERAETAGDRTRARLALARVRETEANDSTGAQRAVEAAVMGDPSDTDALTELERLADKNGAWRDAAAALANALATSSNSTPDLWARLGAWQRDKVGDVAGAEEAFVKALVADPENVELVRAVEALRRGPGRERDRITALRRLAELEGEPQRRRDLTREAAQIAEATLADAKLAEEILRELLADNDGDAWATAELTRLRENAGDHAEVVTLLLKRADGEADGVEALKLRHRAAEVAAEKLGDRERATKLYEAIFEQERGDTVAQERLRVLYAALGKDRELARLLGTLIELAESVATRSQLRLELARLHKEKFASARDAVDTLRAILEEEPDHDEAARMLAAVFAEQEQYSELAELQTSLVERAKARGDVALELARTVGLAEILESLVKDARRALDTYEAVLARDPQHRGALDAVARLAEERSAWDKAERALATLLDSVDATQVATIALRLANVRKELGDDAGVEQALRRAIDAEPTNTEVRTRLAQVYERASKWAELANLLVSNADVIASAHGSDDVAVAAKPSLAPGVSAPPPPLHVAEQVKLLRRAAEIHVKERKSPADAVPVLERIVTLVPNDREVLLLLCDAYTSAQREKDAAAVLEKIIASFGNKRTKELSLYHHRLGRALSTLGDKNAGLSQFDMAFKIDPGSVEVLRDLGVLALETNDLDRAQKTFRALLLQRLDDKSGISKGEVFYYLGEISMKQGDKAKAVQMLERAVENEPNLDRAKAMLTELKN